MKCDVADCELSVRYKGLCYKHYRASYLAKNRSQVPCVTCGEPAQARQLCPRHYQEALRKKTAMPPRIRGVKGGACGIVGCTADAVLRGRCRPHYMHDWRNQKGVSLALRRAYYADRGGRCDLCGTDLAAVRAHLDHDHSCSASHRPGEPGCLRCVRGLLCATCNHIEGMVLSAQQRGVLTGIWGPLADYLSDPPMQRWLRALDAEDYQRAA